MITREIIDRFFDAYAGRFNDALEGTADVDETMNAFAPCFVEASPAGIRCSNNDDKFREAIPKGYKFYRNIGTQSMNIRSKELTILDELHVLVKVDWQAHYKKKNSEKEVIDFTVFYLLQVQNEQPKIFCYVTGDEQKVLKAHGLLPSS
jgi:hypothetical protein